MLPLLDVQLEWCFADVSYPSVKYGSFVSEAVQISARHNLFVFYLSIFVHEIGGISWLNCETCHFCFDPAFVWPSLGRADFHPA